MKRLHVHVGVTDLDQSIRFYSALFATEPGIRKDDYAKWRIDDPRMNFAISVGRHASRGIQHLGVEAERKDELSEVHGRLKAAARPAFEEGRTTCCYANSEKSWISDPDGIIWETFYTDGEATTYGGELAPGTISESVSESKCCRPKAAA